MDECKWINPSPQMNTSYLIYVKCKIIKIASLERYIKNTITKVMVPNTKKGKLKIPFWNWATFYTTVSKNWELQKHLTQKNNN